MKLTVEQQRKAEENMGLVHQVIKDKVHGYNQWGFHTYDDLFQIGCIGLCKAAATDKGGTFSTYAYRLIWHEICDELIRSTKRYADEMVADVTPYISTEPEQDVFQNELRMDLSEVLSLARKDASPSTTKGIDAMILMSQGYTSSEIGERMGASAKLVCAWVSKARKFLKARSEMEVLAGYRP
ncbi:sigma-70 family RNA polymerase sigma factor [Enterocloster bolteae]|uniref:sigma-70 family RNA polymerase sigma factor n=1 Tax=Enterocloster bolteae TaxID=208479 RepID=UPI0028DBBF26|nr:sigma-70 family RNA polymerase sigma factor [Enterocloster bolteae]